jgi:hypothetical protein
MNRRDVGTRCYCLALPRDNLDGVTRRKRQQIRYLNEGVSLRTELPDDVRERRCGSRRVRAAVHVKNNDAARMDIRHDVGRNPLRIIYEGIGTGHVSADDGIALIFNCFHSPCIGTKSWKAEIFFVGRRIFAQQVISLLYFSGLI